jgi:hypothetical protein
MSGACSDRVERDRSGPGLRLALDMDRRSRRGGGTQHARPRRQRSPVGPSQVLSWGGLPVAAAARTEETRKCRDGLETYLVVKRGDQRNLIDQAAPDGAQPEQGCMSIAGVKRER